MDKLVRNLARWALAAGFVRSGAEMLRVPGPHRIQMTERAGLPHAGKLVRVNGGLMLAGGLLTALGKSPRAAPVLLAGLLVVVTPVGHPFWNEPDEVLRRSHEIHWMKNLGLFGGLILLAAQEPNDRLPPSGGYDLVHPPTG